MTDTFTHATRPNPYTDPCANTDQCRVWTAPDDRCHRNTQAHSDTCSVHADRDTEAWWTEHLPEECCPDHCGGEVDHV